VEQPTYLAVADQLEAALIHQPAGTRVESEHELAKRHGVNRLTAKAALDELEQRHLVKRRRGSGTFVMRRYDYVLSTKPSPSWSEAVRAGGGNPRAEVVSHHESGETLRLARLGFVNEEKALFKHSELAADLVPGLLEALPRHGSLYDTLDRAYGLRPQRTVERAELIRPPSEVAERLELKRNTEVIAAVIRTDSERLNRRIELTRVWLRTDFFRLVVEF
jgi:GntR family transcriptional regulator